VVISGFLLAAAFSVPSQEPGAGARTQRIRRFELDPVSPRVAIQGVHEEIIHIISLEGGHATVTLRAHSNQLYTFGFNPDGSRLVTTCADGKARVFELERGTEEASFDAYPGGGSASWAEARWSTDGKRLLTFGRATHSGLWDVASKKRIRSLGDERDIVEHASWGPDSKLVVTTTVASVARLWDGATGEPRSNPIQLPAPVVYWVALDPSGRRLAIGCKDACARVVDISTGSTKLTLSHEDQNMFGDLAVGAVEFSRDGAHILTTSFPFREVRSWDASTGREEWRSEDRGGPDGGLSAGYSPEMLGAFFVDRRACWTYVDSSRPKTLAPDPSIASPALSTGKVCVIAEGDDDGNLLVRDAGSPLLRYTIALSADGRVSVRR
jgi:WD40 repeat protein